MGEVEVSVGREFGRGEKENEKQRDQQHKKSVVLAPLLTELLGPLFRLQCCVAHLLLGFKPSISPIVDDMQPNGLV